MRCRVEVHLWKATQGVIFSLPDTLLHCEGKWCYIINQTNQETSAVFTQADIKNKLSHNSLLSLLLTNFQWGLLIVTHPMISTAVFALTRAMFNKFQWPFKRLCSSAVISFSVIALACPLFLWVSFDKRKLVRCHWMEQCADDSQGRCLFLCFFFPGENTSCASSECRKYRKSYLFIEVFIRLW